MSEIETGGPAFPEAGLSGLPNGEFIYGQSGMTLREYYAIHVDVSAYNPYDAFKLKYERLPTMLELAEYISQIRFLEADCMLKEEKV